MLAAQTHAHRAPITALLRQLPPPLPPEATRPPLARATGQARRPGRRVHAHTLPGLPRPSASESAAPTPR